MVCKWQFQENTSLDWQVKELAQMTKYQSQIVTQIPEYANAFFSAAFITIWNGLVFSFLLNELFDVISLGSLKYHMNNCRNNAYLNTLYNGWHGEISNR